MNAEYEFRILSPFHDVKPVDTRLNLARERTRLEHEADHCVLSLRTEIMDIDAEYQKSVFVRVLRFGQYLMLAATMMSFWLIERTAMLAFIAAVAGLVLINIAVWSSYRYRKAKRTRYWNFRKSEIEDQKRAVAVELAKIDQRR